MNRFGRLVCLTLSFSAIGGAGTISIQPSIASVPLGTPFALSVNIAAVSDLFAWQFDIGFDPAVLSATGVTEGALFSSVGVFFSAGVIDNAAGTISFIGDSMSGSVPGISEDGTLAVILFNSIGAGSSSIDLSNVVLLDSSLNDITMDISAGSVSVGANTPVPEPAAFPLALLLVGAIAIGREAIARKPWLRPAPRSPQNMRFHNGGPLSFGNRGSRRCIIVSAHLFQFPVWRTRLEITLLRAMQRLL